MRRRYQFYGYVQGVGFRWRAKHAASLYGVTGYVHNCYDGSVEMEAEGSEESIDRVIQTLQQDRYIEITDMTVREIPEQGDRSFSIR